MALAFAPIGREVTVTDVRADEKVKRHLQNLGITVGGKVTPLSSTGGNMIFRVLECKVALDCSLAMRIMVA